MDSKKIKIIVSCDKNIRHIRRKQLHKTLSDYEANNSIKILKDIKHAFSLLTTNESITVN